MFRIVLGIAIGVVITAWLVKPRESDDEQGQEPEEPNAPCPVG